MKYLKTLIFTGVISTMIVPLLFSKFDIKNNIVNLRNEKLSISKLAATNFVGKKIEFSYHTTIYPFRGGGEWLDTDWVSKNVIISLTINNLDGSGVKKGLTNDLFIKLIADGAKLTELINAGVFDFKLIVTESGDSDKWNDQDSCQSIKYSTTNIEAETYDSGEQLLANVDQGKKGYNWTHLYGQIKIPTMKNVSIKYDVDSNTFKLINYDQVQFRYRVQDDGGPGGDTGMVTSRLPIAIVPRFDVGYSKSDTHAFKEKNGKTKSLPDKKINDKAKSGKFPYGINFIDAGINHDLFPSTTKQNTKVIDCYYTKPTTAYFNFLDNTDVGGYGETYTFLGKKIEIQNSNTPYSIVYYYDTLEINFGIPSFKINFDINKDIPPGATTIKNLLDSKTIDNLNLFTDDTIKYQLWSDTMPRYGKIVSESNKDWSVNELSSNDSSITNLNSAVTYSDSYRISQVSSEYNNVIWSDNSNWLNISLKDNFWNNVVVNNIDNQLNIGFRTPEDDLQNYLKYDFKYVNATGNILNSTITPSWKNSDVAKIESDAASVETSHKVLNHTNLICRDNSIIPIEETIHTSEVIQVPYWNDNRKENDPSTWPIEQNGVNEDGDPTYRKIWPNEWIPDGYNEIIGENIKTYKALMKLKLNDFYLQELLAGYDIATIQSKIQIDDYKKLVADWTLKFDRFLIDKDNEIWNVLKKALNEGKLIDINKSQIIDYIVPNTTKKYFDREKMLKYDINHFLMTSTATSFIEFKKEIDNLNCPFKTNIVWNGKTNLLDDIDALFKKGNNIIINYSYSTNYNSMILGESKQIIISWHDFINDGVILETPNDIQDSKPATLRINNIVTQNFFDSYESSSKVFGLVKKENETKNSLGINFVIYQNNAEWYDPNDPHDPNNPDYIPDQPINPVNPISPDEPNDSDISSNNPSTKIKPVPNSTVITIVGIIGFIATIGATAFIYIKKRRNATANLRRKK